MKPKKSKLTLILFLAAAIVLLLTGGLWLLVRAYPDFFFPGYRTFIRGMMQGIAAVTSLVPAAVWDCGAVLLALLFFFLLLFAALRRRRFLRRLAVLMLILSLMASEAVLWMLCHYAPPLAEELGLDVRKSSKEELYEATLYYFDKASEYAPLFPRDGDGSCEKQDFKELAVLAGESYDALSGTWKVFLGTRKPVKELKIAGNYLLRRGICGMFMPITAEAGVPGNEAALPMAFTMCHEAAHRLGIAGEDEANLAAFLSCAHSEDPRFLYSGYQSAFIHCQNALWKKDRQLAKDLLASRDDEAHALVLKDTDDVTAHYKLYEKEKLAEAATRTNDAYLKTFSVESGVASYGEVVDGLLAWYRMQTE